MNTLEKLDYLKQVVREKSGLKIVDETSPDFKTVFAGYYQLMYMAFYHDSCHGTTIIDTVAMNTPNMKAFAYSPEKILQVFFHEIAHATGGIKRLNRISVTCLALARTVGMYEMEEVTAIISSQQLMHHFGLQTPETEEWTQISLLKEQACCTAAQNAQAILDAQAATNYILNYWLNDVNFEQEKVA